LRVVVAQPEPRQCRNVPYIVDRDGH